ncbi:MAG: thermonuclease family protein [Chloroflexota bacterium]|nr:thermonuclease family protein [Chloroflexota bacterium]
MGTRIGGLRVVRVVDGDTIRVALADGTEESLRLACVDTEESLPGRNDPNKPVTAAGKAASAMAKAYFAEPGGGMATVDLEFETDGDVDLTSPRFRDNYGRLLCYVHKGEENYNLKLVRDGWSPYFVKYGRSRPHHAAMIAAEAEAQAAGARIWDPATNAGGPSWPYERLIPWWEMRGGIVEEFRRLGPGAGALDVRLDYDRIKAEMERAGRATVLCDLQAGIQPWRGGGALLYAGSVEHPFNLWIDDASDPAAAPLLRLLETRYAGSDKRNYVYVTGEIEAYRGRPQIVLSGTDQLSDVPPG